MAGVVILTPHRDERDYRAWREWFLLKLRRPPGTFHIEVRAHNLTTVRTMLADRALHTEAEWLFWLDDDMIGPDNCLEMLMGHGLPVVGGLYMTKKDRSERGLAAWMRVEQEQRTSPWDIRQVSGYMSIGLEQQSRLVRVDVTGLGCCLIHRSVFEKVPKPWFVWEADGNSEDFTFFEKVAATLDIRPVIDMECRFKQLGTFTIDVENQFDTPGM